MAPPGFELKSYQRMLQAGIDAGYKFVSFSEIGNEHAQRSCLLRHDIDSELLGCGEMLDVEKSLGVTATYFLMTRSTAYNLFSVEATAMVTRLLRDGHKIGLHFMGERCEGQSVPLIVEGVLREVRWLEQEFGVKTEAVSFHQPTKTILDAQIAIPGLSNTYNASQMAPYFYVSDTNMTWRHEHPVEIFSRGLHERLQLLVHPMWWTADELGTLDKWRNVLRNNQRAVIDHWKSRERTLANADFRPDSEMWNPRSLD
jgi:peptidoglycan/xylan/chitin deacetylase (PgdA/CDA1 family)